MEYVGLGKTDLLVSRVGFGAMSLNEIENEEDVAILIHKAYDAGVNFFDIAHSIPESEKRLGASLNGIRQNVILATKTDCSSKKEILSQTEESLFALQTDYIDLFQYEHQEQTDTDFDSIYSTFGLLKERGKIRHFGIATQSVDTAFFAVESGIFETIQFPFNMLTGEKTLKLVELCAQKEIGFIGMQPLYGGLVRNLPLAQGFLHQFENVVPLWGVRTLEELTQILYFNDHPPVIDDKFKQEVEKERLFFS